MRLEYTAQRLRKWIAMKGVNHNSQPSRNHRKENLASLFGMSQGTDMAMYDYEFGENGALEVIHKGAPEK